MKATKPPVYFYIPQSAWPASRFLNAPYPIPKRAGDYWQWRVDTKKQFRFGQFNWTLQTFLHLKDQGFPCHLVKQLPASGIVVAHRDALEDDMCPGTSIARSLLLVCIMGDRDDEAFQGKHPHAQLAIVQNRHAVRTQSNAHYIPFWPHASLIAREKNRKGEFANIVYPGAEWNLAPELKSNEFKNSLEKMGFRFRLHDYRTWDNYSQVDAVLAVRKFDDDLYFSKPATKLHNAWRAGVPAILGAESAFRDERRSELDYIEVQTYQQVLEALVRLKGDADLRRQMSENGIARAQESSPEQLVRMWWHFLEDVAMPYYHGFASSSSQVLTSSGGARI